MKKNLLLIIGLIFTFKLMAQKEDNMWIFGYHFYPSFIPALDFYYGNPFITGSNTPLEFNGCDASICNGNGDMLLYTDGATLMNYLHDTVPGSKGFNDDSATVALYGYMFSPPKQSVFIVPNPGHSNQYIVIHNGAHIWNNGLAYQPINLSISVVDMNMNSGAGQMITKNQIIISDTLLFGTLQTVRHANGRDWWILVHKWNSSDFYLMLLSPNGTSNIQTIQAGPYLTTGFSSNAQSLFSPDGNYFAIARSDSAKVELFNFDRCTGTLSFKKQINLKPYSTTDALTGCSFSANSQVLYVSDGYSLFQYDLTLPGMPKKLIANWDGSGSFYAYYFMMHQLASDGKIYIAAPPSDVLHVINTPDLLDTACNFTQHSVSLTGWHFGVLPIFPNYHLGPVTGSLCDSLNYTAVQNLSEQINSRIYPNPNAGDFYFEYGLSKNNEGAIGITDATGRIIYRSTLSKFTTVNHIQLKNLKAGIYILKFFNGNKTDSKYFVVTN